MTKIPVDEAPAGPEMDAAVARVLESKQKRTSVLSWLYRRRWPPKAESDTGPCPKTPPFSSYIGEAWLLALEQRFSVLRTRDGFFVGFYDLDHEFLDAERGIIDGHFSQHSSKFAVGETASLAICRAFLKVSGVEYIAI